MGRRKAQEKKKSFPVISTVRFQPDGLGIGLPAICPLMIAVKSSTKFHLIRSNP